MPTSFNTDGKPGFIYNAADDVWYEISGKTDTSGTFEWAGLHTHLSSLTAENDFTAKKGTNNFLNPAARDVAITSPVSGTVIFLRQNAAGNTINQVQFYNGSNWVELISQSSIEDIEIKGVMGLYSP
jgi:hypothetical protein